MLHSNDTSSSESLLLYKKILFHVPLSEISSYAIIMSAYNLILIRHGQSQWNQKNRFTGWVDIDLSIKGKKEAKKAAEILKKNNLHFDIACTSFLKRAIRTLWITLDEMDQMWIPVIKSWRLNERHYGNLTGLNKKETIKKYGKQQVQLWRRDYNTAPPLLSVSSQKYKDQRYKDLSQVPKGESLKQTKQRVLPFWKQTIAPCLQKNKRILIVAHGNSIRALIKHIENLSNEDIAKVEVPTGVPVAYSFSKSNLQLRGKRKVL